MNAAGSPASPARFNPFPGLRPFTAEEDYLFFGREEQISELLSLLRRQRFLAVVGTSGSGKSSIVRAGLMPELLGGGMSGTGSAWEAVTMRPGGDPLANLARAFCEANLYDAEDPDAVPQLLATLNRSGSGLIEAARQSDLGEGTNLLILVDQFEEVFRLQRSGVAKQDEARSFVRLLLEASAQQEIPIYVVLTMRSDYLGDCALFSGLAEAVNEGEYLIPRFSRDQLQAAIEGPVKVGGGTIAFRLLQRLLNDVGDQQDQLPVLQHALMRTWDRWEDDHAGDEPIDLRHYEAVGTMSEALSVHADEVFAALASDEARQLAARIFKALTEKGSDNRGIRRPLRLHTLAAIAGSTPGEIIPILNAYRAPGVTFLMPGEETELADPTVIDISHESLMRVWQRLRTWVEDEAQSARIYRRLVDTAQLWEDGKAGLYHDPDLQIAQSWREETAPTKAWARLYGGGFDTAMRFLDASHEAELRQEREKEAARQRELEQARALAEAERLRVAEQEKGAHRLRKLLAAAAAIAVVAIGASIFAVQQTRKARISEAASEALAGELKTNLVQGDWELSYSKLDSGDGGASLAYLSRAMRNDPSFAPAGMRAVSTLTNGTIPTRRFAPIEHEEPISNVLHNEKHDILLTSSAGGRDVRLWEFDTGEQRAVLSAAADGRQDRTHSAAAATSIVAQINKDFAGASAVWLAADPDYPPAEPRYFRKSIPIPEGRTPTRADFFIEGDDSFILSVNGTTLGEGESWNTTFHLSLAPEAIGDGIDLLITARNGVGTAGLVGAVFVSFEDGEPLVATTDASWQSSADPEEGFTDSRSVPPREDSGKRVEEAGGSLLSNLAWSADGDRVLAQRSGALTKSIDAGPQTAIRFVNRTAAAVSLFWLDRNGQRKSYGRIEPGKESLQGTRVGHVFLVVDQDNEPVLIVQATPETMIANIDPGAGPIDLDQGTVVSAWDVATGEPTGTPLAIPSSLAGWQVAPLDGPDDLIGCEFSGDGSLQVWNRTTGQAETPRLTTGGKVVRWRFTGDGRRIVGLFSDSRIGVWETIGGAEVARFDTRPTFADGMHLSPDGKFVAATDQGNRHIVWWEIASGRSGEAPWLDVPFSFQQALFHPSGDLVSVIGSEGDGILRAMTWSLADRALLAEISSNPKAIRMGSVGSAFAIIGAVNGNLVTVWELAGGEIIQVLSAPELLESANLSPDGRRIIAGSATSGTSAAAGSAEKKLFVFDLFAGRVAIPKPIVLAGRTQIVFSPDAETLVTLDDIENMVRFWDLRTGRQVREPVAAGSIQGGAVFSRSGSRAALVQQASVSYGTESIGQRTGRIFIEQIGVPPALPEFIAEPGMGAGSVHATSDGQSWLVWTRRPGDELAQLVVKDARSLEVSRTLDFTASVSNGPTFAASDDGRRIAFMKTANSFAIADSVTGRILAEVTHEANAFSDAMAADGSAAAFGFVDGTVMTWSERDGVKTLDPFPETDAIRLMRFNRDGSLLGIADRTRATFTVIESRTGEPRIPPVEVEIPVDDLVFAPDDRFIAVSGAGSSGKLPVFDLATGERIRELELQDWSRGVDLSADGEVLAAGSGGSLDSTTGVAYLFEIATGRMLTPPLSAGGTVMEVAFDPQGAVLATGTSQTATGFGYAQLWDVATGRALTDPVEARGMVQALEFLPDGSALAVGWSNGAVIRIPVPPRDAIPGWLPDLAEAVGIRRLAPDTGVLERVGDDRLDALRGRLTDDGPASFPNDAWLPWARWIFADPRERAVSPGATTTMARHLARLRAASDIFDLHQAVRWSPGDALTHARLAVLYQEATPGNLPARAKQHWDDAAVWFSDRAIALAPDDVDVWTMRADLMRRLSRSDAAAEATTKVLALAPADGRSDNPNALYQNALSLASEGKWDEAGEAFGAALGLLDDHRRRLDAGEQPLPLLGVLQGLVPTRKASAGPQAASDTSDAVGWSDDPIPGTSEDFEGVVDGRLPDGWSVWNRSDRELALAVHHLNQFDTDLWRDWVVLERGKFEGVPGLPAQVLREEKLPGIDGKERPLLDGRFALAVSRGRLGHQVQFLESPDFDCSGQSGVHLVFNSAYEAHARAMGIIEYSIDRGATWLPVRYLVHKAFLEEAASAGAGPDAPPLDLGKLLDTPRNQLPWWIEPDGKVVGGNYGAFVSAPRDHPGLTECFEGREPTADNDPTSQKRVEAFPLPQADGQRAVRLRFGLAGSNARYWGIDNVGLHAGNMATPGDAPTPEGSVAPEFAMNRPASDPAALAKAAMESAFGRQAADGDLSGISQQMTAAGASTASPADGTGAASGTPAQPAAPSVLAARLLAEQALALEGGSDPSVRGRAALVMLRQLQADKAWDILTRTGGDGTADLANNDWRSAMGLASFIRGAVAAAVGNREAAYALLTVADQLVEGNDDRNTVRQALAELAQSEEEGALPDDLVLVPRGSPWSYFDEGRLPGGDWMQPGFDDSRWFRGRAPLGGGDPGMFTTVQLGPDGKRFPTIYFRTSFEIDDVSKIGRLVLNVRRDDGVIIYLNGTEIVRDGMPDGDIGYETFAATTASDDDETRYFTHHPDSLPLRAGTNWLAVEVHQVNANSSDLGFDLDLLSTSGTMEQAALALPVAVMAKNLESLGVPNALRADQLRTLVEAQIGKVAPEALQEGLDLVLAASGDATRTSRALAELLRLQALAAEAGGDTASADRLYGEALASIFAQVDAAEPIRCRALPLALREAALLVRRGPADHAFLYERIRSQNIPASEKEIVRRWARAVIGTDRNALEVHVQSLIEDKAFQEALAIADAVLATLPDPAPGAPPADIRIHKDWLKKKEAALALLGRTDEAARLRSAIFAAPPRDPALPRNLVDLSASYNCSLYDGRGWGSDDLNLAQLPETFPTQAPVDFDLRGIIQLCDAKPEDGGRNFPERVEGIPVGTNATAIHFLLGAADAFSVRETQSEVARVVMNYADGTSESIALTSQVNITDYWYYEDQEIDRSMIAWTGRNTRTSVHPPFQLIQVTWTNPHPEKAVATIDFVSAKANAEPFLVAVTYEPAS